MGNQGERTTARPSSPRATPALSKRARFRDAVVLSAEWSNMAGAGACELALVQGPRSAQLWHWMGGYGPAARLPLGRLASWRNAVEALALSEQHSSCIQPAAARVAGFPRYVGQILAMAWSGAEGRGRAARRAARLLCRFPDSVLAAIDAKRPGVFDADLQSALAGALGLLDEAMLDLFELPDTLNLADAKPATLRHLVAELIAEAAAADELRQEAAERMRRAKEALLLPWRARLGEMERRWRLRQPSRHYPGGGNLPPVGLIQLMGFVERHIAEHGALPAGVHTITAKPNPMSGVVAALTVNFDELLGAPALESRT